MKTSATASKESERLFSGRTVTLPSPTKAWHTLSDVSLTPTLGVLRSANTMIVAINARLLRIAR